jgi:hypothetical protein
MALPIFSRTHGMIPAWSRTHDATRPIQSAIREHVEQQQPQADAIPKTMLDNSTLAAFRTCRRERDFGAGDRRLRATRRDYGADAAASNQLNRQFNSPSGPVRASISLSARVVVFSL